MTGFEGSHERARRARTVFACFLGFNFTTGLAYGTFGPLLPANEAHFAISRAQAAMCMSLLTLTLGTLSPLLGSLINLVQIRFAMMAGAALSALAYVGIALTDNYGVALLLYALLGIGVAVTGIIGPLVLVSRWFIERRGTVLAIVCTPLALFVSPFLVAQLLPHFGRSGILLAIAALFALLVPLLAMVAERPANDDAAQSVDAPTVQLQPSVVSARAILTHPAFWTLSLAVGILAGVGVVGMVHLVPYGLGRSMTLPEAAGLISALSGAGLLGTPFFGWLSDKTNPFVALAIACTGGALLWVAIIGSPTMLLYVVAAGMGICVVPINTLHGVAVAVLFDARDVSKAIGYSYLIKLPFIFGLAPIVGWLFETTGSYRVPFFFCATLLLIAALTFAATAPIMRRSGGYRPSAEGTASA